MVEPLQTDVMNEEARDAALSYCVELWDAEGARMESVLGRLHSASLGFACYYGALREYVDRRIVLRHGSQVVAAYNPTEAPTR